MAKEKKYTKYNKLPKSAKGVNKRVKESNDSGDKNDKEKSKPRQRPRKCQLGSSKSIIKPKGNNQVQQKKAPIPLTQKERKRYQKNKVAVVFNEEERKEYMAGFYGAKKRRKQEYIDKKKERQKVDFKKHQQQTKKIKAEQYERYRQIIEQNDKNLEELQFGNDFQKEKKEILTTANDVEVEIVTEFL